MTLTITCPKHPRYTGQRAPKKCPACEDIAHLRSEIERPDSRVFWSFEIEGKKK